MSKRIDYSIKFYKGKMTNTNQDSYQFYLAGRTETEAREFLENYIRSHGTKYHIILNEIDIEEISLKEVTLEDYGKEYGYEIIN